MLRGQLKGKMCSAITNNTLYCDAHKNLKHHELFLCQARKVVNNKFVPCDQYTVSASHHCNDHKLRHKKEKLTEAIEINPEIEEVKIA
jgi:hypothetical protein